MNTFAHSISLPRAQSEATDQNHVINTILVVLALALAAALISGALIYRSMTTQLNTMQTAQAAAQDASVKSNAVVACVQAHGTGAAAMSKCRAAAAVYADPSTGPAAFDRASSFIFPQLR